MLVMDINMLQITIRSFNFYCYYTKLFYQIGVGTHYPQEKERRKEVNRTLWKVNSIAGPCDPPVQHHLVIHPQEKNFRG